MEKRSARLPLETSAASVGAEQKVLRDGRSGCSLRSASSASPCDRLGRRLRDFGGTEMDRGERHYKRIELSTPAVQLSILTAWVWCLHTLGLIFPFFR